MQIKSTENSASVKRLLLIGTIKIQYSPDIIDCFPIGWDRAELGDNILSGVVSGQGEPKIIIKK
jgi:hypothetical protein